MTRVKPYAREHVDALENSGALPAGAKALRNLVYQTLI